MSDLKRQSDPLNGERDISPSSSTSWYTPTPTLPRRMDGTAIHTQYTSMLALPKPSLSLTRCAHSTTALDWTPTSPNSEDFFDLLHKLQGSRLDDQRCSMPLLVTNPWIPSQHRLENILNGSPPYPMVSLPPDGGFWCDPSDLAAQDRSLDIKGNPVIIENVFSDMDESPSRMYRAHFLQSEHFNFCGHDEVLGPVVLSIKYYHDSDRQSNHVRIILRLSTGTHHQLISRSKCNEIYSPIQMARMVRPDLTATFLQPILCPNSVELLLNYDEHVLVKNFKFGVIFQKLHQTSEEALFGNKTHSSAMDKFLDMIGQRVALAEHSGYRGGLDTQFGQTGQYSVYTEYGGKEVMFHVATLLPFSETDSQQLQRKRHIGNDIVSIVFQEGSTPFSPDMVTSHFLHAYIVIQPEPGGEDKYRVSVTARSDVPNFAPSLPIPPVFKRGPQFKEWLLNKLINAETACYKSERFSKLTQRTQETLLNNLVEDLTAKTHDFIDCSEGESVGKMTKVETSFFKSVKKVIASRAKSQGPESHSRSLSVQTPKLIPKSKSSSGSFTKHTKQQEDENLPSSNSACETVSFESVEQSSASACFQREASPFSSNSHLNFDTKDKDRPIDSSNARHDSITRVITECVDDYSSPQLIKLQQEVAKLKVDKLELLRQNVTFQREVKRLRERELQLGSDLTIASREINRLRVEMKKQACDKESWDSDWDDD